MKLSNLALLALLSCLWSAAFTMTKVAVVDFPPMTLIAFRLGIAALALALYLRVIGVPWLVRGAQWRLYTALAVTGNALPFFLIAWGLQRIDSGLGVILIGATPMLTLFVSHWTANGEPLTLHRALGVGVGFLGIVVLIGPGIFDGLDGGTLAKLSLLGAAVCYATNAVLARQVRAKPAPASTAITAISVLMIVPASLIFEAPWSISPPLSALLLVLVLGVLSTALATVIFLNLVARAGATFAVLVNYMIPILGVAWGVLFLGEQPAATDGVALALIVLSVFLVNRRIAPPAKI